MPANLGRCALGSFSAGNGLVQQFLGSPTNRAHRYYLETLQERYMFDAPHIAPWVAQAQIWAGAGNHDNKMIRCYTREHSASYHGLLGSTPPAGAGASFAKC